MANPKRRHSNSRTGKRRAQDALPQTLTSVCPQCGSKKLSHRVCPTCGHYRGKVVVAIED